MAVINPLITNNVSDTFWSKLWIQSTGQPAAPACTSSLRVASPSSNLCALASATDASTLAATLKHWLLFGCTHRWPHGEPLVPLDVIVQVHERLHKYVTCAQVQGAVEKRLTRTQAADFTLVAAYVRGMVAIWPARVTEIAGGWALVVTRVETELDKVDGDVGVEERRRVRNMCWEVFRAVVDVGVYDKFSSGKCT
ncbi:hypothetical protein BCR44DRAFT_1427856 [Catenaria anguillulae PL171]|uniref:Uncharacterized protein n=1 Tax=Catenaria anguillulae PL171 TaxID=765915 RepID=A0A1Y2HYK8_9FUNG|nr:hypothetical protein BCR44DRAFT_1427856 [Catenaria anguillulae PL171]